MRLNVIFEFNLKSILRLISEIFSLAGGFTCCWVQSRGEMRSSGPAWALTRDPLPLSHWVMAPGLPGARGLEVSATGSEISS